MSKPLVVNQIENRVKIPGDTMYGNLKVNVTAVNTGAHIDLVLEGYPTVALNNTKSNRIGFIDLGCSTTNTTSLPLCIIIRQNAFSTRDLDGQVGILIYPETDSRALADRLIFQNIINETRTNYRIYGEHNKPSPSDIGAAASSHTHNYLPLDGGTMSTQAIIAWQDPGYWDQSAEDDTYPYNHGGLYWNGQSDQIAMRAVETARDNLELVIKFTDDNSNGLTIQNASGTSTARITATGEITGTKVWGAVWNDYTEFRAQEELIEPGYCVISQDNGKLSKTKKRLSPCDGIVSDTFGFAIGKTPDCQTPVAIGGRVLAYCEGDRASYHAGDTVCAGLDSKVSKMSRREIQKYPDRIVGIVSEIPEYKTWGSGKYSN